MWLIPGKTKVRLEIFKGVSLIDILIGLVGAGAIILAFLSNLSWKLVLAGVFLVFFTVLLIRVDETPIYEMFLCVLQYLACPKAFLKKEEGKKLEGKDMADLCAFTAIEKNIIRYGSNYVGAVIEIPAVEFRLFSRNRKNMAITSGVGGLLRNMNPNCGVNIVKLERPVRYDQYREAEIQKLKELKNAYENGALTEEELKARVDIVYNRVDDLNHMMDDKKVVVPFYYIVLFDSDERQLENQVRSALMDLKSADMKPKRLNTKELALFLKYSNDTTVDESELDKLSVEEYASWAMPKSVKFHSNRMEINDVVTYGAQIVDYPLMEGDAWLATVMTIPATKVVVKCTGMEIGKAIKDIDKSLFELRGQLRQTSVQSRLIELNQHIESLSSLLVTLKGENEILLKTNVYVSEYDIVTTEKMGRKDIADHSELARITNMKRTVKRVYAEQNLKLSSPMFEQFNCFVGSQISAFDPYQKSGRSIPGNSLAACFPWVFARIEDEKGIKLGTTDHVPVFVDFFKRDSERVNSNLVIIGKSGSGKSYATKSILSNLAADNVKIFVLDPENEYSELAENLHGKFINVANAQYGRLNPFHVITSLEDGDSEAEADSVSGSYSTHLQFLEEFFKQIMPDCDKDSLEYLNTIVDHMYLEKGITAETNLMKLSPEDFPTFDDLYDSVLKEFQGTENEFIRTMLRSIMNYISKFASGGRNANIWNGPSSITTDENFTVFNFQTLLANRNASIANAQMLLVLKYIDNEIIKNREYNKRYHMNRKIAVVIDEAHVFIDTKFPVALDFMFQLAKRIRKYNGMQIVITQNIKDFVGSEDIARKSSAIINASQYSLIFSLAPNDLADLCKLYEKSGGINEIEQETISTAPRGLAFSVMSPMQRTTFQIETSKDMVKMFSDTSYQSSFFTGQGGENNWEEFLGDSKENREKNIQINELLAEENDFEEKIVSHVRFDELSEEESEKLLLEREAQKAASFEEVTPEVKTKEEPVFKEEVPMPQPEPTVIREVITVPSEQNQEDHQLILKLLERMSDENISHRVREEVQALVGAMKEEYEAAMSSMSTASSETASTNTSFSEPVPADTSSDVFTEDIQDTFSETPSTAIGKIEPVKIAVPKDSVQEDGTLASSNLFEEGPEKSLEEDEDLLDVLNLLNEEAKQIKEVSVIEQMELFEEDFLAVSIEDLQKFIRNRKALRQ